MTRLPLLLALACTAAAAQDAPPRWGGAADVTAEVFPSDREAWVESRLAVQRRHASGAVVLEVGETRRNGLAAQALAADVYQEVHPRAYVNVRLRAAPGAAIIARSDVLAEAYVAVGGDLEASAGVRHLTFEDDALRTGTEPADELVGRGGGAVVDGDRMAVVGHIQHQVLPHHGQTDQGNIVTFRRFAHQADARRRKEKCGGLEETRPRL